MRAWTGGQQCSIFVPIIMGTSARIFGILLALAPARVVSADTVPRQMQPGCESIALVSSGDLKCPPIGATYEETRALFLRQGLSPQLSDSGVRGRQFPEVDCSIEAGHCRAYFIYKDPDHWRRHLEVWTFADTHRVEKIDTPPDFYRIPPPPAPDVPRIRGSYLHVRRVLLALSYRPISNPSWDPPADACRTRGDKQASTDPGIQ